jgi:hypothetical protein
VMAHTRLSSRDPAETLYLRGSSLCPSGMFHPSRYSPGPPARAHKQKKIAGSGGDPVAHPPRINPVIVSKFQIIKVLGKGGQVSELFYTSRSLSFCFPWMMLSIIIWAEILWLWKGQGLLGNIRRSEGCRCYLNDRMRFKIFHVHYLNLIQTITIVSIWYLQARRFCQPPTQIRSKRLQI